MNGSQSIDLRDGKQFRVLPALLVFKVTVETCMIRKTRRRRGWRSSRSSSVTWENGRCQHQHQCHFNSHHHHHHQLLQQRLPWLARHWPIDRYTTKCGGWIGRKKRGRTDGRTKASAFQSLLSFKHKTRSFSLCRTITTAGCWL